MLKQILSTIIVFVLLFNTVSAVEHPSVKITKYDPEIAQGAGATKTYQVGVENTGDVPLDSVYLSLFFLPSSWYQFEKGVRLEVNEKKVLNYSLSIPSDASGSISYKLTANAIRGFGIVSNSTFPVVLSIQKGQTTQTATVTSTTTQTTETTTQTIATTQTTTQTAVENGVFKTIFDSNVNLMILILVVSLIIALALYKFI